MKGGVHNHNSRQEYGCENGKVNSAFARWSDGIAYKAAADTSAAAAAAATADNDDADADDDDNDDGDGYESSKTDKASQNRGELYLSAFL